ncbi:MAG TPA: hypothetical protein VHP61_01155 [Acidobacteriota bacterium]|nr:hypothetical protein [Acidobacteriota bacterium]
MKMLSNPKQEYLSKRISDRRSQRGGDPEEPARTPRPDSLVAAGFSLRFPRIRRATILLFTLAPLLVLSYGPGTTGSLPQDLEPVKEIVIPGNVGWVDTGLDVEEGEELFFRGEGEISLQKGNPDAACGPDGADIQGLQQPVPGWNLGGLAGKVAQVMSVRKGKKTGEEFRDELVRYFFIGHEQSVAMPIRGRLYVGVNENVIKDNDGQFQVAIFKNAP